MDPLPLVLQAVTEASYVNLPVIAFCNTNSPLRYIDIAIPCNNHVRVCTDTLYIHAYIYQHCQWHHVAVCVWLCVCVAVQGKNTLGLMWWFLCREVLRLRGTISRELPWDIMPDLFFYRDPEEVEISLMSECNV